VSEDYFYGLARGAQQDPASADFALLRRAYVESDAYRPLKHISHTQLMQITDSASGFEEVIETCRNIVEAVPLDLEAWRVLALAYEKAGDKSSADKANLFTERLLDSILATGDGKSFETAFQLVAQNEAWVVMRVFGIRARSQEEVRQNGRVYEVFDGKIDEREVKIYFDVTDPVRVLDETLERNDEA
jgi:hypothetical protein